MEKPLVVANWKMNPQKIEEAEKIARFSDKKGVVVCPPYVFLNKIKLKRAKIGAQNCFFEKKGAFTGEVSPLMLKNLGCEYVIVGHSERRDIFKEEKDVLRKKMEALLEEKITPILCVGEDKKEDDCLKKQLEILENISLRKIIIAYEPKFAIGTGNPCDKEEAEKKKVFIKSILARNYQKGEETMILYGGSVDAKNALSYIKEAGFDGLLVGGASLKEKEFKNLLKSLSL
jgi:triosephosphate isomerase (TIM)